MLQGPHYDFGTAFQLKLIFIFVSLHCEPICISFKMVTDCLMPIYQTRTFETEIPFQLRTHTCKKGLQIHKKLYFFTKYLLCSSVDTKPLY